MAQRAEKEETEFKVPEILMLCANNCGVTGGNSVLNPSTERSTRSSSYRSPNRTGTPMVTIRKHVQLSTPPAAESTKTSEVNRCSGCRRKVGLTDFRCRCGELFCADHRYSDRHDCSYDYKSSGRETIARENPVVKAAKIIRI
ncbi:hypothetical protein SAY86_003558 [Trapa natans]|uniref:AN1-type domain-containing protein n=1 Tax=Trapa natans TaxID=22666 RepID=A0AAN7MHA9_TRANT|nr:hypothetical protein SAY86_003558 [Trapa natans]